MLQEHHGVVVTDGRNEQALGGGGGARHHDLDSGVVRQHSLGADGVERSGPQSGATRPPNHHRHRPPRLPQVLGGFGEQLVHAGIYEVGVLQLDHRPQSHQSGPDRTTHDRRFGDRGVDDPIRPVLLEETLGDLECPTEHPDVFAEQKHRLVVLHLLVERFRDGVEEGHRFARRVAGSGTRFW